MRSASARWRGKAAIGFSIAGAAALALASLLVWFAWCASSAATIADPDMPGARDADGFPQVDWEHWQQVNPDVIGWVSIPGTALDTAIVQAHPDAPTYYLDHDIRGMPNYHGCPYLDASCIEDGLEGRNAVIFGHNIQNGDSMFAELAGYAQPAFAREHAVVLVQTPAWKRALRVSGAAITAGSEQTKRTAFDDAGDFRSWYRERLSECCVRLRDADPERCITLVTCSYNRSSDERTLVYAIP